MGDRTAGEDVTDAIPSGPEVASITGEQVRRTVEKLSVEETTQEKTPASRSPEPQTSIGNMTSAPTIDVHSLTGTKKVQEPPNTSETAPGSYKMASVHGERSLEPETVPSGGEKHQGEKQKTPAMSDHQDLSHMYNMNHNRRGLAVVINNRDFDKKTKQKVRKGTDIDADSLFKQLSGLGFEMQMNDNLTCKEMKKVLKEAAAADHSDTDCILVALLSHGEEKTVYGTDGTLDIADLAAYFNGVNCKSLVGKPKIFIIQACQGSKLMEGVDVPDAVGFRDDDLPTPPQTQTLPAEADFLYYYSTMPGYLSWRNQESGSWTIQSLCAVLKEHGKSGMEIMQILTRVNRTVATQFESRTRDKEMDSKKQIPCIMSMLTKELYFTPKI
ncbi:PREDICTED: caspase-3-like [Branchiostoma belcheri]|uniref:Caspase-3-like n=1 Tax=Branchiostoma belcheri TaxID=7741 RepID=A0A6P4ZRE1_BRABE|nr:PREDICTED: caspase-3-like [Branchiostoma belcheri]